MNGNWYATRWRVLRRDSFTCRYCGQSAPSVILHVDHVAPKAKGGMDTEDNLITACSSCNIGKNLSLFTIPQGNGEDGGTHRKRNLYGDVVEYLKANGTATATEISKALDRQKSRCNIAHLLSSSDEFAVSRQEGRQVYYMVVGKAYSGTRKEV